MVQRQYSLVTAVLFLSLQLGYISTEISVLPERAVITLPEDGVSLNPFAILLCNIQPTNVTIDSRWVLPNGQIITQSTRQYLTNKGATQYGLSSLLIIQNLSYKDAGFYTCEIVPRASSRSSCTCADFPHSATIELQLEVHLVAIDEIVNVQVGVDTSTELACEMSGIIHPDEDLEWFRGEKRIFDGEDNGRYSITVKDGTPGVALNGNNVTVASRLSVLRILNPNVMDEGDYTCKIRGTRVEADISLIVINEQKVEDKAETPTDSNLKINTPDIDLPMLENKTSSTNSVNSGKDLDANIMSGGCKLGSIHIAIVTVTTFAITAVVSVLTTLLFACVCLTKHQNHATVKQTGMKNDSVSSQKQNGSVNVLSAVNTSACVDNGSIQNEDGSRCG